MCEAESGFRYINGFPDSETGGLSGPPVRPNISLGDSVAGLHAAFGTVSDPVSCQEASEPILSLQGACIAGAPRKA